MTKLTRLLIAAVASCGAMYGAHAADLSQPPRVLNYPAAVADPSVSGWYLRGDIGVGIVGDSSLWDSGIAAPAAGTTAGWLNRSIGDTTFIDVGVGYQFTDNLRGDVTLQYRNSTAFQGANYITCLSAAAGCGTVGATGENDTNGSVSSVIGLVNGYYDITRWNGLTPYVGAGIGLANNRMHATSSQLGAFSPPDYGIYPQKDQLSFAWALHTGLSYDINPRLKLEMGYSYLNYGDAKSGPLFCENVGVCGNTLKVKGLYSNDFHIGMRWLLDVQGSTYSQASYQTSAWQQQQSSSWQQPVAQTWPQQSSGTYQQSAPVVAKY